MKWVRSPIAIPPPGQGNEFNQIAAPVDTNMKAGAGAFLVISTSGSVAVQVAYDSAPGSGLSPRAWLDIGTWSLRLLYPVNNVRLSSPTVPWPAIPDVTLWLQVEPLDDC